MDPALILFLCFALLNLTAFCLMAADKSAARRRKRRIPEKILFLFALLFGGTGGTLGMFLLHHKTRHWYFKLFFPLLAAVQLAVIFLLLAK